MSKPKTNLPSIADLAADGCVADVFPLPVLRDMLAEIADKHVKVNAPLIAAKSNINASIAKRVNDAITGAYVRKGVDTGVVHIERDGLDVVVDRSKTVTWDQAQLAAIAAQMVAAGDNPADYLKITYAVSEASYVGWPPGIRKAFEPARTVKPGAPTIKLADLKAVAA